MFEIWSSTTPQAIMKQFAIANLLIQLWSGMTIWEITLSMKLDYAIARGRRACRYSLICCLLCRYAALATVVFNIAFLTSCQYGRFHPVLFHGSQITQKLSFGGAYIFLTARAVSICSNESASWALGIAHVALWGVILTSIITCTTGSLVNPAHLLSGGSGLFVHKTPISQYLLMSASTLTNIVFFVAVLRGLLNNHSLAIRNSEDEELQCPWSRFKARMKVLYNEGFHYYVLLVLIPVAPLIADIVHVDTSGLLRFLIEVVAHAATIMCGSRVFSLTASRAKCCPVRVYCVVYNWYLSHSLHRTDSSAATSDTINVELGPVRHPAPSCSSSASPAESSGSSSERKSV